MCRVNPRVDLVFKKLFGAEENKDLLKSLINSLLPQEQQIDDLELKNPYNLAAYMDGKLSILDIKAVDSKGKWYDVEIQVDSQGYYGQRAMYYWGKVYTEQMDSGETYSKLKKTIVISILDFNYFPDTDRYHRILGLHDYETKETYNMLDYMDLHFVELKKYNKDLSDVMTTLERWVTFLNHSYEYEKNNIPKELAVDKEIKKAIEKLDTMYLDKKEREYYEAARKAKWNAEESIRTAKEIGWKKGMEEGREEGREEGEIKRATKMARNMLLEDEKIEKIMKYTGLSREEIEELSSQ